MRIPRSTYRIQLNKDFGFRDAARIAGYVARSATPRISSSESIGSFDPPIEPSATVHPIFFGQYSGVAKELSSAFNERGVRLKVVDSKIADYLQHQGAADVDVAIGRWVADYPDSDTFAYGLMHTKGGATGAFSGTPELDKLIERGRVEIDPAIRHAIYREVDEMVARDALLIPLFHEQVYRFVRPEIEGLSLSFVVPEVSYETLSIR